MVNKDINITKYYYKVVLAISKNTCKFLREKAISGAPTDICKRQEPFRKVSRIKTYLWIRGFRIICARRYPNCYLSFSQGFNFHCPSKRSAEKISHFLLSAALVRASYSHQSVFITPSPSPTLLCSKTPLTSSQHLHKFQVLTHALTLSSWHTR